MKNLSDVILIIYISLLLAIMWFIQSYIPALNILSDWNYVLFYTEIVTVAGTCVLATGIPCAVAFVVTTALNLLGFIVTPVTWLNSLIFIPLFIGVTYVLSKLARGN